MQSRVSWDGAVAPGLPVNPVRIEVQPLVAAMLAELIRDPDFQEQAKKYPRAYEGILGLGAAIDGVMYVDSIQNPAHYDVPPGLTAKQFMREIRAGIDRVPSQDHTGLHRAIERTAPAHEVNSERVEEQPTKFTPGRAPVRPIQQIRHRNGVGYLIGFDDRSRQAND